VKSVVERVLGRYETGTPGPTLIVLGGLHGNEPSGVHAARRVLERLQQERPPLRGQVVALAGNLEALARQRRFLTRDLNRAWTEDRVTRLRDGDPALNSPEDMQQRDLLRIMEEAGERADGHRIIVLDLHTTSGESPPFTVMSDTRRNRRIAFGVPGPVLLGLEESIDGSLLSYATERGHVAVLVESGQHDAERSIDLHEAVIWLTLASAGCLTPREVPDYELWRRRMDEACKGLPRVVELRYRHAIDDGDDFRMEPGLRGFTPIRKGDLLARDRRGEIRSQHDGHLLMPLYQEQGSDGFFIIRRVSPIWLWLSAALRALHLHGLVTLFPGVTHHPDRKNALRVDPKVARWFTVEIFHLFGYRRRRRDGEYLIFTRRRPG